MNTRKEMTDRLARLIIEKEALKFGDFTLASGKKSDYYVDGRIIALFSEGSYLVGNIIHSLMEEHYPDATSIGGLLAGAVPVASAVAQASYNLGRPIEAFMVRKETKKHGTLKYVEGPLKPGEKVVVVDDVITTGGSTVLAIEKVEEYGCEVLGVISVVDREETKVEKFNDYKFVPILTITQLRAYR